jgi:nucleotide-binding universal stress UspA family protein
MVRQQAVRKQIAVGVDGSLAGRHALRWAVREAVRLNADVLVVTACPPVASTVDEAVPTRLVDTYRIRVAILAARAAVPGTDRVVVGRQVRKVPVFTVGRWGRGIGSAAGLTVDLLADDVSVPGMAGGLLDHGEQHPPKIARLPVASHRGVRVANQGDDLVAGLARGTVLGAQDAN